jgi:hypothetical protein
MVANLKILYSRRKSSMNTFLDDRKIKCLDGLYYSFEIIRLNYNELYETCVQINNNQENIAKALSQSWSIIDMTHRVREIAQSVPGLNKKDEKLLAFLGNTKAIEQCRHYIQHLRGELTKLTPNPYPVWGSLAWVDPNDVENSYIAIIGASNKGVSYSGCVYDRVKKKWVSKVTLGVETLSINFDPLYREVEKFRDFIIPWVQSNLNPTIEIKKSIPVFSIRFAPHQEN